MFIYSDPVSSGDLLKPLSTYTFTMYFLKLKNVDYLGLDKNSWKNIKNVICVQKMNKSFMGLGRLEDEIFQFSDEL